MSAPPCCSTTAGPDSAPVRRPVRVWADGCFDLMHIGHANALRQAKLLGDVLVVGVHSDAEVLRNKGPTIMTERERYEAVRACKWVDEVVEDAPYVTQLDWMDRYNIDFCVHGEDISVGADGRDTYELVKNAGRFRIIKRTEGVSTTELVGRMLVVTQEGGAAPATDSADSSTTLSKFINSSRKINQFSSNRLPQHSDRIVYVDGGFDLFHVGHISFLQRAREHGTYLIVGVHEDRAVERTKGRGFPIMSAFERTLSVLQCRYVDEAIIGAPVNITADFLEKLNVNVVVRGRNSSGPATDSDSTTVDPYAVPKATGIYFEVDSEYPDCTTVSIVSRVMEHRKVYEERNRRKLAKEEVLKDSIVEKPVEL